MPYRTTFPIGTVYSPIGSYRFLLIFKGLGIPVGGGGL